MKPLISFCMICKNEEKMIARCLNSIKHVVDEMIVVDTGSTDKTIQIATSLGAKVYQHEWVHDFAVARNSGLERATGDWILFLDADEELHPEDGKKLRKFAKYSRAPGCYLKLINFVGKSDNFKSSTKDTVPVLRFFRNHHDIRFVGRVHEQIGGSIRARYETKYIPYENIRIFHYGYLEDIVKEQDKIKRNFKLIKKQVEEEPKNPFHHYNIAGEYIRVNQFQFALEHLRKAKSLCEINRVGFGHLIVKKEITCLDFLGRHEEALEVCRNEIKRFQDYPDLLYILGRCAIVCQKNEEAKEAFRKVMTMTTPPSHYVIDVTIPKIKAPFYLAKLFEEVGEVGKALNFYEGILMNNGLAYYPAFERFLDLMVSQEGEKVLLRQLRKLSFSKIEKELIVQHLYEANFYELALQLVKEGWNDNGQIKNMLLFLTNHESEVSGETNLKLIVQWIKEQTLHNPTRIENSTFIHFLHNGEWPDDVYPTKLDWELLEFAYKLSRVHEKRKNATQLMKLWKYFIFLKGNTSEVSRGGLSLALNLVFQARSLLNEQKSPVSHLWEDVSHHIPYPLIEQGGRIDV
ncbi:glycosyltransferase [Bacillus sp. FJAT-45350]|uniref:glycosyltransferase n=1 Tax=Bacillus sp. FJAT-45350 TaxID=2011014 RepID=UPI000BB6C79A|nr:glycosyltransferase [Bacillus sp. FJAT-45350]